MQLAGMLLYSALPLSYLTGCYRLLNFKNFHKEIGLGLVIDLLLNAVAMLIVQGLNNSYLNTNAARDGLVFEFSNLQSVAVIAKLILLPALLVEFALFFVKLHYLNKYKKAVQATYIDGATKLNEVDRRKVFAKKYAIGNIAWLLNCLFVLTLVLGLTETQTCKSGQAPINDWTSAICLDCLVTNCAACTESGAESCDACFDGYYLDKYGGTAACLEKTCLIEQCAACSSRGPRVCDACNQGFALDTISGQCRSTVCKVSHCQYCSLWGPEICDECFATYEFNRFNGQCEDTVCKKANCEVCTESGIWGGCDRCAQGYYYDIEL